MDSRIFEACLNKGEKSWEAMARELGYSSGEALRSSFRRNKKSFGGIKAKAIEPRKDFPRIIIFDIETSPIVGYVWGLWNQNLQLDRIVKDWNLISWSAKQLFASETWSDILTPEEAINGNDERISKSLWEVLDSADIVIAHNAKGFDCPRSNSRFLYHHLLPPSYTKIIDTLEASKKVFGFTSNKLDYICGFLNLEQKKETDFSLWQKCLQGDPQALKTMREYNIQDVNILEDMYVEIRPWIRPHPNVAVYGDNNGKACPNCGSEHIVENGHYATQANKYISYRCSDCGALSRGKDTLLSKEKRKSILMS